MSWLQLIADTRRADIERLEEALLSNGAVSVTLQEHIPQGQTEQPILEPSLGETPLWDNSRIIGLFESDCDTGVITENLQQQLGKNLPSMKWEQLEDKDWEREWMDNYHPIQCGDTLWICPSWQSPPDPNATNILLDPGLAFGTGTHPTTFLCMQWLGEQKLHGKTAIDYGCGSGILGIAALLLGAKEVCGVDIDPQALIATKDNATRNGLHTNQFPVYLPKEAPTLAQVDLVIANILAGPLVELAETLLKHLNIGGQICLSGILAEQANAVRQAYSHRIQFEPIAQKEGWVRLNGQCIAHNH
jgi:ribosomal protein L11 methyltransferase